jgi:hypothetical protein
MPVVLGWRGALVMATQLAVGNFVGREGQVLPGSTRSDG